MPDNATVEFDASQVRHVNVTVGYVFSAALRQALVGCRVSVVGLDGRATQLPVQEGVGVNASSEVQAEYQAVRHAFNVVHEVEALRGLRLHFHVHHGELDRILTRRGSKNVRQDVKHLRNQVLDAMDRHDGVIWCYTWNDARQEREPERYRGIFAGLQARLRREFGSRGDAKPTYWVNMADVARLIDEIEETVGKKPSLLEATVYHLRADRKKKFKDIADNLRMSLKQVHNAYNRLSRWDA